MSDIIESAIKYFEKFAKNNPIATEELKWWKEISKKPFDDEICDLVLRRYELYISVVDLLKK